MTIMVRNFRASYGRPCFPNETLAGETPIAINKFSVSQRYSAIDSAFHRFTIRPRRTNARKYLEYFYLATYFRRDYKTTNKGEIR